MTEAATRHAIKLSLAALAAVFALALAAAPMPAHASGALEAGGPIATQAKAKAVYLITRVDGRETSTQHYTYGGQGLVTRKVDSFDAEGYVRSTTDYAYDKRGHIVSETETAGEEKRVTRTAIARTADGLPKVVKVNGKASVKYAVKGGKVKTRTTLGDTKFKCTYTYDKKGRVKQTVEPRSLYTATMTYTYDKKGNLASTRRYTKSMWSSNGEKPIEHLLKYKGGRVVQRWDGWFQRTYTYKKASVPANMAKAVAAQQWAIVNDNVNLVF